MLRSYILGDKVYAVVEPHDDFPLWAKGPFILKKQYKNDNFLVDGIQFRVDGSCPRAPFMNLQLGSPKIEKAARHKRDVDICNDLVCDGEYNYWESRDMSHAHSRRLRVLLEDIRDYAK